MKGLAKKAVCLVMSLVMIGSLVGCSKKSDKSSDEVVSAASDVMDALIARNGKKLSKAGDFSDETIALIDSLKESDAVSAIMDKAKCEVDAESVKESKKGTSVKVAVTYPDVAAALADGVASEEDLKEAIDAQKEKEYSKVDLTLEFSKEDDAYTLTNGDDVAGDLYASVFSALEGMGGEKSVVTEKDPTDTEPTVTTDTVPTDTEPTTPPTEPPAASSATYDVVVFSDDKTVIHFNKVDSEGVHFTVENLSDRDIKIQASSLSVDGLSIINIIMSDDVPAGGSAEVIAKCETPIYEKIGTVSGRLRVIDSNDYSNSYDAHFDTVVIDDTAGVEPAAPTGTLLAEDENLQVYFKEITSEGVVFEMVNLTALDIQTLINSVAINGRNLADFDSYYEDLAPHSMGEIVAQCKDLDLSEAVGTVSGQFDFSEPDRSFDEYRLTANTTIIDDTVTVTPPEVQGTTIYEDENVRITFEKLSDKGPLYFVENLTDYDLIVQAESLSVNMRGIYDVFLSMHTAPHSVCEVVGKGDIDASQQVGMVGGAFIIANPDDRKSNYMVHLDNVVVDGSVTVETAPEGTLVYEDENVRIYFKEVREKGVAFDVENLTPYNLTMQDHDLQLNGVEPDGTLMSDDVAPHSVSEIFVKCKPDTSVTVTEVTIDFSVFTWDDKVKTYHAIAENVAIG
ncbi:MAG: hypothetical protein IK020_02105 [Clostridiales bacterium]|nr:hypothetical protein [Clostridiales bacterium]